MNRHQLRPSSPTIVNERKEECFNELMIQNFEELKIEQSTIKRSPPRKILSSFKGSDGKVKYQVLTLGRHQVPQWWCEDDFTKNCEMLNSYRRSQNTLADKKGDG